MSNVKVARDFFKAYLPLDIQADIDFESLTLEKLNTSTVRDNLKNRDIADVLFYVTLKGLPAYLLVHAEHQSRADKLMPLRVLNYASSALLDYARTNPGRVLPPIISLVYYHGRQKPYPYTMNTLDLFGELPEHYKKYIFNPLLIDLSEISDEELSRHGQMAASDMLFKHIFDPNIGKSLDNIFKELSKTSHEMRYFGVQYLVNRIDYPPAKFIEKALKYLDEEDVMTIADQFKQMGINEGLSLGLEQGIERGMERGLERGVEKGSKERALDIAHRMLLEGLSVDVVSKCTGLPASTISHLKKN